MKSIYFSCVQDFKCLLTNALFWVLTATLAVIVLVVDLALPKQAVQESYRLVTYNAPAALTIGERVESYEALKDAVYEGGTIGVAFGEDGVTIVHPGYSEQTLNAMMLELSGIQPEPVQTVLLEGNAEEIPLNLRSVPVFVSFEALMVGFILGGALMLAEKQEATVRALRVSPFGTLRYTLAKTLLFSLIGVLYATLITVLTVGFDIHWGLFVLLTFFGTAVFTLLGLAFTAPFHGMSGWFFAMAMLLCVNMLPVISFYSPAFSPLWIRLIPSYPILMAYRGALFGSTVDYGFTVLSLLIWGAIAFLLALLAVNRRHLKEARA